MTAEYNVRKSSRGRIFVPIELSISPPLKPDIRARCVERSVDTKATRPCRGPIRMNIENAESAVLSRRRNHRVRVPLAGERRRFEVGSGATRRREVTNERYLNIRPEATQIRTCFRMKMDISESACKTWASSAFLSSKCGASASERRVFRLVRDPDGSEKFRNWYMSALRASGVGRLRDRGFTGVFRSPEKMADNIGEICVTWYMDVLRRPEASRRRGRGAVIGFGPGGSSDVFPRACTCVNQISQCLSPPAPIRCTARDHARGRGWKIGVRKDLIQLQASAIHNVEGYATHLLSASILDNPRQAN
ncbi:hypothetical protein B0H10DRAFT_1953219 [Mycena sp. CBHHK59/15]|nr:hypothetical protein B0H10DRAFT_1953219 [Mycena sp. CBHHK59/15]